MTHREEFRKRAQALRKESTKEERHLWYDFLKNYPVQFKRQAVFGNYIVDFYCPKAKLVVELDGAQHYEGKNPDHDRQRTEYLEKTYGVALIRFPNSDINQHFKEVCQEIERHVKRQAPSSAPFGGTFPL